MFFSSRQPTSLAPGEHNSSTNLQGQSPGMPWHGLQPPMQERCGHHHGNTSHHITCMPTPGQSGFRHMYAFSFY